jgi:hypothetical protein
MAVRKIYPTLCYHINIKLCRPVILCNCKKVKPISWIQQIKIVNRSWIPNPIIEVFSVIDPNYLFSFDTNNVQKEQVLVR